MTLLYLGLILWIAAHFVKRLTPSLRDAMANSMGAGPARGVIALSIVLSVVLMILGYRGAPTIPVYNPIAGMGHLNNLLMYVAIVLFGMGASKGRMRSWLAHPMLTGMAVWAGAHVLVNGDKASIILFGSLGLWALVHMGFLYATVETIKPEPGEAKGDLRLLLIAAILFIIITGIHVALGYNPFLGTY